MEKDLNPNNDPFQDAFFAASYIELVLENIHRGFMDPDSAESTAATIRHITDTHPNFWLITFKDERRASIPISVKSSVIVKDESTQALSFWTLRLDVPEWIEIDHKDTPMTLRVLPMDFDNAHLNGLSER